MGTPDPIIWCLTPDCLASEGLPRFRGSRLAGLRPDLATALCSQLLEAALALTDVLAAMGLVLRAKPIVAGRYSAAPWTHYMQPLTATFRRVTSPLQVMV